MMQQMEPVAISYSSDHDLRSKKHLEVVEEESVAHSLLAAVTAAQNPLQLLGQIQNTTHVINCCPSAECWQQQTSQEAGACLESGLLFVVSLVLLAASCHETKCLVTFSPAGAVTAPIESHRKRFLADLHFVLQGLHGQAVSVHELGGGGIATHHQQQQQCSSTICLSEVDAMSSELSSFFESRRCIRRGEKHPFVDVSTC
jgi:hypothetical protein